jgi:hypothetical protein
MPPKRRKGKQGGSQGTTPSSPTAADSEPRRQTTAKIPSKDPQLVLTSDKRRGVYECDYCHADISQVPRIRCAVCPDFDLCLDCFATTDHSVAVSRIRAASAAHGAVQEGPTPGISASAVNHSGSHKYRVADSTRYPLFPSARAISKEMGTETMSNDGIDETESKEQEEEDSKKEEDIKGYSKEDTKEEMKEETKGETKEEEADAEMKGVNETDDNATEGALKVPEAADKKDDNEPKEFSPESTAATDSEVGFVVQDDPKTVWTVEEDLRLLDAIATCGLGNWADIAEAISGQGSSSKTAKRCMERYFDDFLGRYGHVLPAYTIVEDDEEQEGGEEERGAGEGESERKKRRMERMSSIGVASVTSSRRGKKLKVVPTASLPGYERVWPEPYLPPIPDIQVGQDVGRDQRYRAELIFVKLTANAGSKEEADNIHKEWAEKRLNQPDGPTALPMRPEDLPSLPGSDLVGFMPRRGDFDMEWENEAENVLADMEFTVGDLPQDRDLKIKVIQIYNAKLDERERRKNFLLSRGLLDYRKNQQADAKLPRDERDLVRRMRLFERLHTPEEHKHFIDDIIKAKRLRKEIAQLQMYRRIGMQTLAEAEKYENDKRRREIHKMSYLQKEAEAEKTEALKSTAIKEAPAAQTLDEDDVTSSLWKQYRTSDRKNRRSVNRTAPLVSSLEQVKIDLEGTAKQGDQQQLAEKVPAQGPAEEKSTVEETPEQPTEDPAMEEAKTVDAQSKKTTEMPSEEKPAEQPAEKAAGMMPADPMKVKELKATEKKDQKEKKKAADKKTAKTEMEEDDGSSFPIAGMRGYDLLTRKEADLCRRLGLKPSQYLKVKKAVIQESFRVGILDKEGNPTSTIVTIDVKKKGNVIDFMVKAGWISTKVGETMKQ